LTKAALKFGAKTSLQRPTTPLDFAATLNLKFRAAVAKYKISPQNIKRNFKIKFLDIKQNLRKI
jgi:hypothetical protein